MKMLDFINRKIKIKTIMKCLLPANDCKVRKIISNVRKGYDKINTLNKIIN